MPRRLPELVLAKLDELKKAHRHSVSVAIIDSKYYALETVKRFDREKGRYITFTHHLGRIMEDGTFVEARHRKRETDMDSLDSMLREKEIEDKKLEEGLEVSKIDRKILTSLSTDARRPVADLSREIGISVSNANYRIRKLEKRYGINYVCETLTSAFGFTRFAVTVKFRDEKPDADKVRAFLTKNPFVHLALTTKGEYDIFFVILTENNFDLEDKIYKMRQESVFADYKAVWNVSALLIQYGYIPLRGEIFELLGERIWHRSKESPVRLPHQLLEREYFVLKELSSNGQMGFSEIDKKYNLSAGSAQYTYHKLVEDEIIKRVTITMDNPPIKYISIIHLDQINMKRFKETRDKLFLDRISMIKAPMNRYILTGDYSSPYGILVLAPILRDYDLSNLEKVLTQNIKGVEIRSLIVAEVIVGKLGFRMVDNHISNAYKSLKEEYNYSTEMLNKIITGA